MGKTQEKLRDVAKSISSPNIIIRVNIFRNEVGSAFDNTGKHNMAKQAHIPFLEEWLRSNSGGSSNIISKGSSSSSA